MFTPSPTLWTPQRRGLIDTIATLEAGKSACLYGPTGSGKTTQAVELIRYASDRGMGSCFYINRRLLIDQVVSRFSDAGFHFGVRAAGWDDYYDSSAPVQICSVDTEAARVYGKKVWTRHDAGLIVTDEAHLQATKAMRMAMDDHKSHGAMHVGLTATPIGLSDWYDELVISGTMKEYRDCKALVPAIFRSISQPDLRRVKKNAVGEFVMDDRKKRIFMQHVIGDVLSSWKKFNPDGRPTMAFAPGVAESVWLCQQFEKMGVSWCHVDANDAILDGHRVKLNRKIWDEILQRYKAGDIKGLCSRFKLREGLDVPGTYMGIFATPIGSLASYIQSCGRILRYSKETPENVVFNDHAGCYHSHSSPNIDRDWRMMWNLSEHAVSDFMRQEIRDGKAQEPIRCPKCSMERMRGSKCPGCSFEHERSSRRIVMESGEIQEVEGGLVKPRKIQQRKDTQDLWTRLYMAYKKKGLKKSFNSLYGFFVQEFHYEPPRNLPFMPKNSTDWYRHIPNVPIKDLHNAESSSRR